MNATEGAQRTLRALALVSVIGPASGCASLHSYQVDDIDSSAGPLTPFEVQVDETGLNLHEAMAVGKALVDRESARHLNTAEDVISLFQVGPSTGNATFGDTWADGLVSAVRERCPSGRITGVTTERETNHYPVVSGEIVTVKGYCTR